MHLRFPSVIAVALSLVVFDATETPSLNNSREVALALCP
jgi:hypothetical protein